MVHGREKYSKSMVRTAANYIDKWIGGLKKVKGIKKEESAKKIVKAINITLKILHAGRWPGMGGIEEFLGDVLHETELIEESTISHGGEQIEMWDIWLQESPPGQEHIR